MFGMFLLELLSTLDVDMVDDIHVNTWFFNLISAGICLNFPSIYTLVLLQVVFTFSKCSKDISGA